MPVAPELMAAIRAIAVNVPPWPKDPTLEDRRIALQAVYGQLNRPEVGSRRDVQVPTRAGSVRARLVAPLEGPGRGLLVFFHGGAWVAGSLESHDAMCRILANRSGAAVLNAEYRLAPEHPFPAAVDDVIDVVRWAAAAGFDGGVAVGGDSAGATLSAVASLAARDAGGPSLALQVLIYPATDLHMRSASWAEFGGLDYGLPREEVVWSRAQYGADPDDWRASPLLAERVDGVCPALVVTAECDPLRDEAEAYAARLSTAGVVVAVHRFAGMTHGFVGIKDLAASDDALTLIADAVRAAV